MSVGSNTYSAAQTDPTTPSTCPSTHTHTASYHGRLVTVSVGDARAPKGENKTGPQVPLRARAHGLTNAIHDHPFASHAHAGGALPNGIPPSAQDRCEEAQGQGVHSVGDGRDRMGQEHWKLYSGCAIVQ